MSIVDCNKCVVVLANNCHSNNQFQKSISKFNGMFALAFWDQKEKTLLIGRDRYGIKPVYFYQSHKTFLFGSEQKSIFEEPSFDKKINQKALLE